MGTKIITPPSQVITTAEIKAHLRHTTTTAGQDAEMVSFLSAARAHAEHYCSQSFGSQTRELSLDAFPDGPILLPDGPVTSITSIKYLDTSGVLQTLSDSAYSLDDYSDLTPWVVVAYDTEWPDTLDAVNAVKVRYVSGAATLPDAVRTALLMHVYEMDQHRAADIDVPSGVISLLNIAKRWGR